MSSPPPPSPDSLAPDEKMSDDFFLSFASLYIQTQKKVEKSNIFSLRLTAQRFQNMQNVGLNFLDWQINTSRRWWAPNTRTKTRPTAARILYCLNGFPIEHQEVYGRYTKYGRFTVHQLGTPCLVILFSDYLIRFTWSRCLIFQLVISRITKKV